MYGKQACLLGRRIRVTFTDPLGAPPEEGISYRLIDTGVFQARDVQNSPFRTNANKAAAERTIAFNQDWCGFVSNAKDVGRGQDEREHRALFEHWGKMFLPEES